jgi:S-methylmethionine-dependent homocysteine/selenocysteine methylase
MALKSIQSNEGLRKHLGEAGVLLGAYANRLTPVDPSWTLAESDASQPFRADLSEQDYWGNFIQVWVQDYGVQIVGGCCGITPEHISYISTRLKSDEQTK